MFSCSPRYVLKCTQKHTDIGKGKLEGIPGIPMMQGLIVCLALVTSVVAQYQIWDIVRVLLSTQGAYFYSAHVVALIVSGKRRGTAPSSSRQSNRTRLFRSARRLK